MLQQPFYKFNFLSIRKVLITLIVGTFFLGIITTISFNIREQISATEEILDYAVLLLKNSSKNDFRCYASQRSINSAFQKIGKKKVIDVCSDLGIKPQILDSFAVVSLSNPNVRKIPDSRLTKLVKEDRLEEALLIYEDKIYSMIQIANVYFSENHYEKAKEFLELASRNLFLSKNSKSQENYKKEIITLKLKIGLYKEAISMLDEDVIFDQLYLEEVVNFFVKKQRFDEALNIVGLMNFHLHGTIGVDSNFQVDSLINIALAIYNTDYKLDNEKRKILKYIVQSSK